MRIEHIALYTTDIEKTKLFFVKYFSAEPGKLYHNLNTGLTSYFLKFSSGARLEIMHKALLVNSPVADEQLGYTHLAISTGSKDAVNSITEQLKNDGYSIISGPRTTGDGYYESVVLGPDHLRVEITV